MGQDTGNQGVGAYRAPARRAMKSLRVFGEDREERPRKRFSPGGSGVFFGSSSVSPGGLMATMILPPPSGGRGFFRGASVSSPTRPLACTMLARPMTIQGSFSWRYSTGHSRGSLPLVLKSLPLEGESARQGRSPRILPVGGETAARIADSIAAARRTDSRGTRPYPHLVIPAEAGIQFFALVRFGRRPPPASVLMPFFVLVSTFSGYGPMACSSLFVSLTPTLSQGERGPPVLS